MSDDFAPNRPEPTNGLGLAGFIVSLVGLISCGLLSPIGLIMSLVAVRREPKSFAIAGIVLGALGSCGIILGLLFLPLMLAGFAAAVAGAIGNPQFGTELELGIVEAMVEEHQNRTGSLPNALTDIPAIDPGSRLLTDGWGNSFNYQLTPDGQAFILFSSGPDGVPGTPDDVYADDSARASATTPPPAPADTMPEPEGESQ